MSKEIIISIPLAPVPWQRVKRGKYGQAYVPPKTRAFELALATLVQRATTVRKLAGPLSLVLKFYLAKPKKPKFHLPAVRPDIDNFIKTIDALNGILWTDDAQICKLYSEKLYGNPPRIELELREITDDRKNQEP